MRKIVVLGFIMSSFFVKSQEVSVEKNINSVQLGLLSLSFQNETRLQRKMTLRSEIGLATATATRTYTNGRESETSFLIVPFVIVEPRWYYGLDRRSRLGKNTTNNSSNFVSVLTSFVSSRTELVNSKDFEMAPYLVIVPEYGFRRGYGKHFYNELSAGVGYIHNFHDKSYIYTDHENEVYYDFQYKMGWKF